LGALLFWLLTSLADATKVTMSKTAVPKDNQMGECSYLISIGRQIDNEYCFMETIILISDKSDT